MVRPKNKTETMVLSITKNCQSFIKRTHTNPQEMLEFKLTKTRETFSFKLTILIKGAWMVGLTGSEVYISI